MTDWLAAVAELVDIPSVSHHETAIADHLLEQQMPEIEAVIAQGDTVVVLGRERGNMRAGGSYSVRWMQMHCER